MFFRFSFHLHRIAIDFITYHRIIKHDAMVWFLFGIGFRSIDVLSRQRHWSVSEIGNRFLCVRVLFFLFSLTFARKTNRNSKEEKNSTSDGTSTARSTASGTMETLYSLECKTKFLRFITLTWNYCSHRRRHTPPFCIVSFLSFHSILRKFFSFLSHRFFSFYFPFVYWPTNGKTVSTLTMNQAKEQKANKPEKRILCERIYCAVEMTRQKSKGRSNEENSKWRTCVTVWTASGNRNNRLKNRVYQQ